MPEYSISQLGTFDREFLSLVKEGIDVWDKAKDKAGIQRLF